MMSEDGIEAPAITICPYQGNPKSTWRNGTAPLAQECNHTKAEDMLDCIESKTFNEGEVISSTFGYEYQASTQKPFHEHTFL